ADAQFEALKLTSEPWENIQRIMTCYLHMVTLDDMHTIRQIYICHIKYHDAYFFDEQRSIFKLLANELEQLVPHGAVAAI
ncbi:hypothetical protein L0N00_17195, partial [Eggerthella lenta]|nr:hypothetical protein [Eggerthella lenta]